MAKLLELDRKDGRPLKVAENAIVAMEPHQNGGTIVHLSGGRTYVLTVEFDDIRQTQDLGPQV